jgi:hypothetical protein
VVVLRIRVFWDVTQSYGASSSGRFESLSAFISNGQALHKDPYDDSILTFPNLESFSPYDTVAGGGLV